MKYSKKEIKKGITIHLINTNKFKTNLIAIFLSTTLKRENVTKNAVLASILRRGSNYLKTQEEISKRLEEMYGAEFNSGLDKIGKNHVLKFYIESINDDFIQEKNDNLLKSSIEILAQIVFDPLTDGERLNEEYVNQEKENIRQIIDAKKDNKARYASFRCMEEMYKGKPEGLYKYGYSEDLEKMDATNLYEYYKELISNCKVDIFISGNLENTDIENLLEKDANIMKLNERDAKYSINKIEKKQPIEKENVVNESMEVTQGKLVIGYDLLADDEMIGDENLKYIGIVYNGILGGTANSKMFQNVREKASLAYTAGSSFAYNSGNIFVNAGIDIPNFEKALEIIKKQIEDMKNGNFDDEEIFYAKKNIISNINSIDDEQDTEIIYFLGQVLSEKNISLEEYAKKVNNVTKEQIISFAKKIQINTIYFLKN